MIYLAFDLKDFRHNQSAGFTRVSVRIIKAKNLRDAKEFIARFYPETAWAILSKRTFDAGIVPYKGNSKV